MTYDFEADEKAVYDMLMNIINNGIPNIYNNATDFVEQNLEDINDIWSPYYARRKVNRIHFQNEVKRAYNHAEQYRLALESEYCVGLTINVSFGSTKSH